MLLGGREHIQDAATDRDLAAMLDQVGARIPDVHQVPDDLVEVSRLAAPQGHWVQVTQTAHHRLQQAAHRGDQHTEGAGPGAAGVRVGEPAQHGQPPSRRVRARRQPFVREGLPGREEGHRALGQQRLQPAGEHFGLAGGRRHGQDKARLVRRGIARDRGGQEGAEGGGRDQVGISIALAQGALQLGIRGDNAEQSSEAHGVLGVRLWEIRQHERPALAGRRASRPSRGIPPVYVPGTAPRTSAQEFWGLTYRATPEFPGLAYGLAPRFRSSPTGSPPDSGARLRLAPDSRTRSHIPGLACGLRGRYTGG